MLIFKLEIQLHFWLLLKDTFLTVLRLSAERHSAKRHLADDQHEAFLVSHDNLKLSNNLLADQRPPI